MEFELSPQQLALAESANRLVEKLCGVSRVRDLVANGESFDKPLWDAMSDQGWPLIAVAEDAGGIGLGNVELSVLADVVGYHATPVPIISTAIAAQLLAQADRTNELEMIRRGSVAALGWQREPAVLDLASADLLVTVGTDDVRVQRVDRAAVTAIPSLDPTRSAAVPDGRDASVIGDASLAEYGVQVTALATSAALSGASRRIVDMSVSYAKIREQFGRPIGSFQAIKHRCADMYVNLEGMRAATLYAAWAVDVGVEDAALASSAAKAWCSEAGPAIAASGLQIHGGIGFTWEHDLHLFLKRIEVDARQFGTERWHRERIVSLLERHAAAVVAKAG